MSAYPSRLRKYRKAAHLSQSELSSLIGIRSQGVMSEVEAGLRNPSLATALACDVLFGAEDNNLFPSMRLEAKQRILANAQRLREQIGGHSGAAVFLEDLIKRLIDELS